jgi:mono/diheme cytochrome c family protein
MRTSIPFFLLLCLCTGIGCTSPGNEHSFLAQDSLPSVLFTIDPSRDTTLLTPHGAILKIPKGALDAGTAGAVQIRIREAYTIEEIVRGRLLTHSKGAMLSSGGMIFIDAIEGQTVQIRKAIGVSIPADFLREGMQVYRGIKDDKGDIDWIDPKALEDDPAIKAISAGRRIFQSNCEACHQTNKELTGPPLAWLPERRSFGWLDSFTRNNQQLLAMGDPYACYIYNVYNRTPMTIFSFSDLEMHELYAYIDNEGRSIDSNTVRDYKRSYDSCRLYTRLLDSLNSLQRRRRALIADNGKRIVVRRFDSAGNPIVPTRTLVIPDPVLPTERPAVYYQFTIDSFGWYNVDILLKSLPGVEDSQLTVRIRGDYRFEADVFLVIPSLKGFQRGGPLPDKEDEYAFLTEDEKIPLPQGAQAYILCMGEYKGQPFFGKVQWTIGRSQRLTVDPKPMTKEEINEAIGQLQFDKFVIKVNDSKNAAQIRSADSALSAIERLKPKFCDCNCSHTEAAPIEEVR